MPKRTHVIPLVIGALVFVVGVGVLLMVYRSHADARLFRIYGNEGVHAGPDSTWHVRWTAFADRRDRPRVIVVQFTDHNLTRSEPRLIIRLPETRDPASGVFLDRDRLDPDGGYLLVVVENGDVKVRQAVTVEAMKDWFHELASRRHDDLRQYVEGEFINAP